MFCDEHYDRHHPRAWRRTQKEIDHTESAEGKDCQFNNTIQRLKQRQRMLMMSRFCRGKDERRFSPFQERGQIT